MELIIEFDDIEDTSKKKYLLETLKFLGIQFRTIEKRQTLEQYNRELEESDAEIDNGNYITIEDLLKETEKW